MADRPETVDALLARMDALLGPLEERKDDVRLFLATYRRTTPAVSDMVRARTFADNEWVERWDVAFANPPAVTARPSFEPGGHRPDRTDVAGQKVHVAVPVAYAGEAR